VGRRARDRRHDRFELVADGSGRHGRRGRRSAIDFLVE
jgi:hypothetical protein